MLLLLALGCGSPMPTWACILEDPQWLEFLGQAVVDPPQEASVHLVNRCPRDLDLRAWIEDVEVYALTEDEESPFAVGPEDLTIGAESELDLTVRFDPPVSGAWVSTLAIGEGEVPDKEVSLYGEASAPVVRLAPQAVDLTGTCIGEEVVAEVVICDIGNEDLWVEAVDLDPDHPHLWLDLESGYLEPLPSMVVPGLCRAAYVHYLPTSEEALEVALVIQTTDPVDPVVEVPVSLSGVPCP